MIFQMDSFFSEGFLMGPRVSVSLVKSLRKLLLEIQIEEDQLLYI